MLLKIKRGKLFKIMGALYGEEFLLLYAELTNAGSLRQVVKMSGVFPNLWTYNKAFKEFIGPLLIDGTNKRFKVVKIKAINMVNTKSFGFLWLEPLNTKKISVYYTRLYERRGTNKKLSLVF